MKRKIIIILLPILLITGCDKKSSNSENKDASLFSVTSTETVDLEMHLTKPDKKLFEGKIATTIDDYKQCQLKESKYIMKVKIPQNCSGFGDNEEAWTSNNEHDCAPWWGLTLYNKQMKVQPDTYDPSLSIVEIVRFSRGRNDITSSVYDDFTFTEEFESSNGIKYHIYYKLSENMYIGFMQILNPELYDVAVTFKVHNNIDFQELYNIIDSIDFEVHNKK